MKFKLIKEKLELLVEELSNNKCVEIEKLAFNNGNSQFFPDTDNAKRMNFYINQIQNKNK